MTKEKLLVKEFSLETHAAPKTKATCEFFVSYVRKKEVMVD